MIKYDLKDFSNIIFEGFNFKFENDIIDIIQQLSTEVGSSSYIKTPTFNKIEVNKKKNFDEWESIKSYKATKIDIKNGLDGNIDLIRSYLNKISDKNYQEQYKNINLILCELGEEDMMNVGTSIFEIASNNRFYSKLYADLYTQLISDFEIMKIIFDNNLNKFLDVFNNIEYVSSNDNYDMFCKINKDNERRKSLSSFIINLSINKVIPKEVIINLSVDLLNKVFEIIEIENKKYEVDEIVENIFILYKKEWHEQSFLQNIVKLSNYTSKDYPSLTNKSIFKFMDMLEL